MALQGKQREKSSFCCRWKAPGAAKLSSSLLYPSATGWAAGTASLSRPHLGERCQKRMRRANKRRGKKSIFWEQACGGQVPALPPRGAQPTTVPFSHPTGTNPEEAHPRGAGPQQGTQLRQDAAPGHHRAGGAREGARGPLAWLAQAVPSRLHLCPTLAKGGGGWQPAERGAREGTGSAGGTARGREPKPRGKATAGP